MVAQKRKSALSPAWWLWDREARQAFTLWDRRTAYGCKQRERPYDPGRQQALWAVYQDVLAREPPA